MIQNIQELDKEKLVPYYLMSCYLYYQKDSNVLSDTEFDQVCKRLDAEWDDIEHYHKDIIDREQVQAASGYAMDFPNLVRGAAMDWLAQYTQFIEESC
jgi:NAD-dependent DNA ligase